MDVSVETIRKNFQSKSETELLELASAGAEISSEARYLLLQELQSRLGKTKQAAETVQRHHGWYTVVTPKTGVRFPEFCPRCARSADSTSLRFESPEQRRFRFFYWKTTRAVSNVPHCFECAAELNDLALSARGHGALWVYCGSRWLSRLRCQDLYFTWGYSQSPLPSYTSTIGHLPSSWATLTKNSLRSHGYAKAFAVLNNVQTENAETLQTELEEAISRIAG